jgi:bifunctional UDP-N-acetylglucosamine pyrophosphorylase/glucosamine-1-phosphate N-acetyltransferase
MDKYAIILAAGKGTRMKSKREDISKGFLPDSGTTACEICDRSAQADWFQRRLIAVIGFGGATSEAIVKDDAKVVWQKEQKGSGHAVMMAAPL